MLEERFPYHALVTLWVIGWNVALINEKDVNPLSPPFDPPFRVREPFRVSSDELMAEGRERVGVKGHAKRFSYFFIHQSWR